MKKISIPGWVKLLFSGVLLYLVFRKVDLKSIIGQIRLIGWQYFFLYFILTIVAYVLAAYRWALWLVRKVDRRYLALFFRATMVGSFYNLFLPGTVGGDLVKWMVLGDLRLSKRKVVFSVFIDRLVTLVGIVFCGTAGLLMTRYLGKISIPVSTEVSFLVLFGGCMIFLVVLMGDWKLWKLPVLDKLTWLKTIMIYLRERKNVMVWSLLIAILIQIISFWSIFVVSVALKLPIGFLYFLIYGSIISLLLIIPISFSGFGVTELAYVYFYSQTGASNEGILALTSVLTAFKIVVALLGWGIDVYCRAIENNKKVIKIEGVTSD